MIRLGFIGYSATKFDFKKSDEILEQIFKDIGNTYSFKDVEIVSGGTEYGIPFEVYKKADEYGYFLTGIICKEGMEDKLYDLDKIIIIGETWGDESETFIEYIDVLYKIGGGKQSIKEVEMAKKQHKKVIEFELEAIN